MIKLDANETLFFNTQLESVKTQIFEKKYPTLKARTLIPVATDVDSAADAITYYVYDAVGMAKIVESYAKDFPRVNVLRKKFTSPVESLGDSYGYSVMDIRKAQKANIPLSAQLGNAARKAMLQKEDNIAFFGDAKTGLPGLLTNPNITEVTLAADGSGASKTWASKTPAQILRDLNLIVNTPNNVTNGVEMSNTLLLPTEQLTLIRTTKVSDNSDMTILDFFLSANPQITGVESYFKLKGAGAGATNRAFTYNRDPDYVALQIPQDFEQFPPQEEGMEFVIYCHERIGGVINYYPLACAFADGI